MAPPRVVPIALGKYTKAIHKARVDEGLKAGALLVGETLLAAIRFRVRKVQFGVRDVQIAAENHRLGFLQRFCQYARKAGSQCLKRSATRLKSSLELGVYTVTT